MFCKSAIESCKALPFGPGEDCMFVANDWHAALVPVLLKDVYQRRGEFMGARTAFCIHNIAFQVRARPLSWRARSHSRQGRAHSRGVAPGLRDVLSSSWALPPPPPTTHMCVRWRGGPEHD